MRSIRRTYLRLAALNMAFYSGSTKRSSIQPSILALACLLSLLSITSAALAQSPAPQEKSNVVTARVTAIQTDRRP